MSGPFGKYARNLGWGKHLPYACRRALEARYVGGHFATCAAHSRRINDATAFWRGHGITDARQIGLPEMHAYAMHVAERLAAGSIRASYASNLISSVNVCVGALRGDDRVHVRPSSYLGRRTRCRTNPPSGLDTAHVEAALEALRAAGLVRAACVLALARHGGLRLREASLADLARLAREARLLGRCNIQDGCKGGRDAPRWIVASPEFASAIDSALAVRPRGSRCLVRPDERVIDFIRREINAARAIVKQFGIASFHDQRAAYACDRYAEITGHDAPVLAGGRRADSETDRSARRVVAQALGHGREDVSSAYVGGRKR